MPYSLQSLRVLFSVAPASPPGNVNAEVLSSTSIMVAWEELPSIDQNGIIITYEVLLEPVEALGGMIMEQQFINSTGLSVNLANLQEFVNYSISVRAYTVVGPGNYGNAIVRMTLEDGKFTFI